MLSLFCAHLVTTVVIPQSNSHATCFLGPAVRPAELTVKTTFVDYYQKNEWIYIKF